MTLRAVPAVDRRTMSGEESSSGRGDADDGRDETARERLDRNLTELTGEMRVVITGVQVLFAFLLVAPFDAAFSRLDSYERAVYFVTLLFAALAAVYTIAPAAQHRVLFRHDDKGYLVHAGTILAIMGLACQALAVCGALLLVATYLFGVLAGALTGAGMSLPFTLLWFAIPLRRARRSGRAVTAASPALLRR
jgi:hypothetical protein